MMIFPWQNKQWQQLLNYKSTNRIPHAFLLTGIRGLGKAHFAECFARTFFCEVGNQHTSCDDCRSCRLIIGRTHPNILWIEPEKAGQAIKVDQIRQAIDYINQTGLQGTHQLVIINPANAMNINAANALLKTLEEPPTNSIIILISNEIGRLPATIISRCQRIIFSQPNKSLALGWLARHLDAQQNSELLLSLAQGAPLFAIQLAGSDIFVMRENLYTCLYTLKKSKNFSLQFSNNYKDIESLTWIDLLLSWLIDLLRIKLNDEIDINNKDFQSQLIFLAQQFSNQTLTNFMQQLSHLRKQLSVGINFNKQMLLENVLLRWFVL